MSAGPQSYPLPLPVQQASRKKHLDLPRQFTQQLLVSLCCQWPVECLCWGPVACHHRWPDECPRIVRKWPTESLPRGLDRRTEHHLLSTLWYMGSLLMRTHASAIATGSCFFHPERLTRRDDDDRVMQESVK